MTLPQITGEATNRSPGAKPHPDPRSPSGVGPSARGGSPMRSRSGGELPQLELDCLAILWDLGRAPVATVHARLRDRGRPLAYTTVLTVLDRLRRKQVVERQRAGRAFVYTPLADREQLRARAVNRVVENYFTSRDDLRHYLGGAPGSIGTLPSPLVAPQPQPERRDLPPADLLD